MKQAHGQPVIISNYEGSNRSVTATPVRISSADTTFDEAWLQQLIDKSPQILPVSEIEPGLGVLVPVCMELPTLHGPIDNLIMTPDGDIVLVEVKLWRNPEARRKVVAQALDYASCLFEMDYESLQAAVLRAQFGYRPKPSQLYDLFVDHDVKDEAAFVDAVNTNLRKGRILILVAGDGIRTETERLASLVQGHGGHHFTFALVELSIFEVPSDGPEVPSLLICPRTLTQTHMIERAIVSVDDKRIAVASGRGAQESTSSSTASPANISAEHFFDAMALLQPELPQRLRGFIKSLEPFGVYADYQRSLNLKWDPASGKSVNLAYITRKGFVETVDVNQTVPHELSHHYIEESAQALGVDVKRAENARNWQLLSNGGTPRIAEFSDRLDAWVPVIGRFIEAVKAHFAESSL